MQPVRRAALPFRSSKCQAQSAAIMFRVEATTGVVMSFCLRKQWQPPPQKRRQSGENKLLPSACFFFLSLLHHVLPAASPPRALRQSVRGWTVSRLGLYFFNAHFSSSSPNSLIFLSVSFTRKRTLACSAGSSEHTWKAWLGSIFLPNLVTQRGQKGEEKNK